MLDWTTQLMEHAGYGGVALLMLLENVFPPIPSEVIMPLAGYAARRGELDIVGVIAAGTAGSVAGALFWYGAGIVFGINRLRRFAQVHGRWLTLAPEQVDVARTWFSTRGGKVVLGGRLIPAVRTLISVPAGVAQMPFTRFLVYSVIGTALWSALLAVAGYVLADQHRQVEAALQPVSLLVVGGLIAWYVYRVWTFDPGPEPEGGSDE